MNAVVLPKIGSHILMATYKQNNRLTTPSQNHIAFIMPRFKGIGTRHKSGIGNNQGRQQTTNRDNQCFNCGDSHSKINELSLPVIYGQHSGRVLSSPLQLRCIND